jgi:hypothetical protein
MCAVGNGGDRLGIRLLRPVESKAAAVPTVQIDAGKAGKVTMSIRATPIPKETAMMK